VDARHKAGHDGGRRRESCCPGMTARRTSDSTCQTANTTPHSRDAKMRPGYRFRDVLRARRAQGMPGAQRTHSLACKVKKHTSFSHHRFAETTGIPCAMVLRFPSCSPRRPGFIVSVIGVTRERHRQLDISVGISGPHDFAVRTGASRQHAPIRPPHSTPNVRDDREAPLLIGRETGQAGSRDLPDGASANLGARHGTVRVVELASTGRRAVVPLSVARLG
jgi:hypothetical protein